MIQIKKNNNRTEDFDINKILVSIDKCFKAVGNYNQIPNDLLIQTRLYFNDDVVKAMYDDTEIIRVWVEKMLMFYQYFDEAKDYCVFKYKCLNQNLKSA